MNAVWEPVTGWLALSSIVGFALMGFDKQQARRAERRVPEKTFFILAFAGGVFGVLAGSSAFHHKNRKGSFLAVILVIALLRLVGLAELATVVGFP